MTERRVAQTRRIGLPVLAAGLLLPAGGCAPLEFAWSIPATGPVVVELVEMAYRPAEIAIPAGRPATLVLRNRGALQHDFSIDALRLSPDVRPGDELTVEIAAPPGRYRVYCTFPGHEEAGMVATLVVEP